MAGPDTIEFTDDNFDQEVLQSESPVLVDFWAEWCAPCKALGPVIDSVASQYVGKAKVGKLDTDANPNMASKFGVSAIPTVILFQKGEIKEKFVGLCSEKDLKDALDSLISAAA